MLPRYIFHKESEEDLEEFLKIASEFQHDNRENCVTISTYLKELQSQNPKASDSPKTSNEEEIDEIVVFGSQSDPKAPPQNENTNREIFVEPDHFNFLATADLTEIIIENLLKEKNISQSNLDKLARNCSEAQIESVILELKEKMDLNAICNLGMALCEKENEDIVVFQYFYEHIFFPLLKIEQSPIFQEMFGCVYKKFGKYVKSGDILKVLLEESCSGIFMQNISKFDSDLKNEILRDLVLNCRQLEQKHIRVLEFFLDKNINYGVIKMIITLLASQRETNDKTVGKLIVCLIEILGRNIYQFEQPLRQIIAQHNSVWKTKIQKMFDQHYECSQLSQTLIKH